MSAYDVVVIGGGMAGVSIASELARDRRVLVVDMEATLAFHTTGRSAAMFLESYGGPAVRALTSASRDYLLHPPDHARFLTPLPLLYVARIGRGAALYQLHREVRGLLPGVQLLTAAEAARLQPLLRREHIELAMLEPDAMEIDVHAVHQDFVAQLCARSGQIGTTARITSAVRKGDTWELTGAAGGTVSTPVVVNAAGAWADELAATFRAEPVGLAALRRTAFTVDAPPGVRAPMIADIDDEYYLKPDAGRLLCSPADETPQQPGDARPDMVEIARAIEAINTATTLDVRHVRSSWAGLRSFVPDREPVVGSAADVEGFFWFAGQGGYGIQTAPALARTGAALLRGEPLPRDVAALGLSTAAIAPDRAELRSMPPPWRLPSTPD